MAIGKSRHHQGEAGEPPWYYWLTSHALMHSGVVGLITGSAGLGVAEFFAHWLIDFGKIEQLYGFNTDFDLSSFENSQKKCFSLTIRRDIVVR